MLSNKITKPILSLCRNGKSNDLVKTTIKNNCGDINCNYYLNQVNVSTITYNNNTGQLKSIMVNNELRGQGIGKYMLDECIDDIKQNGNNSIHCYSYDGHPFWSNVYDKKFRFMNSYDYKSASTLNHDETYGKYEMEL